MNNYPAKLLLFGEHTVNLGSQALAMPLSLFSGRWKMMPDLDPAALAKRQMRLPEFADYLDHLQQRGELLLHLDLPRFKNALAEGLIFDSDIPTGYGAGSSGSLTAAVLDEFGILGEAPPFRPDAASGHSLFRIRTGLAQMEAFFHGTSSGTDPLICFLQKTVLLGGSEGVKIVTPPPSHQSSIINHQFFLLDTGIERKATPLIEYFLEKSREPLFRNHCENELLPAVDAAISSFLSGDFKGLFGHWSAISEFQFHFFERMIPADFQAIWQKGLAGDAFKLKICGAGGGGFILGIANNWEEAKQELARHKLLPLVL